MTRASGNSAFTQPQTTDPVVATAVMRGVRFNPTKQPFGVCGLFLPKRLLSFGKRQWYSPKTLITGLRPFIPSVVHNVPLKRKPLRLESLEERVLLAVLLETPYGPPAISCISECHAEPEVATCPPHNPSFEELSQSNVPNEGAVGAYSLDDTFYLHSNPGSKFTIYLDFTGHTTVGTSWNISYGATIVTPAYDTDGNPNSFSNTEHLAIQRAWSIVAEDFIAFDVNVTTEEPPLDRLIKSGTGDDAWGIRVVIGGSCDDWYHSAGGVAYLDSFNWNSDTPCFVFKEAGFTSNFQEAISHEIGHTLGLRHDGNLLIPDQEEYYRGANGWGPIMGSSYSQPLTQWSKGEYNGATNTEDDLDIITRLGYYGTGTVSNPGNGFTYRVDDHGNTIGTATLLTLSGGSLTGNGIIERNTDVDLFKFTTTGGSIAFAINGITERSNLDIKAELLNSAGSVIYTSNPTNSLNATISTTVGAGTYYIRVSGDGKGDPKTDGYSNYGSLGQYTIVDTWSLLPALSTPTLNVATNVSTNGLSLSWNAIDNASSYTLQYRKFDDMTWITISNVTSPRSVTGLMAGTQYVFQIKAIGNGTTYRDSNWSGSKIVWTLCSEPTGVTAVAQSSSSIKVDWQGTTGVSYYLVERSANGSTGWTTVGTPTSDSYIDTDLSVATTYYYRVFSVNSSGNSVASATVNATTPLSQLSPPILNVATGVTTNSLSISWNTIANASSYTMQYRRVGDSGWTTISGVTSPRSVTGLTAGTQYEFQLKSVGDGITYSDSNWSGSQIVWTLCSQPIGVIANIQSNRSIRIDWATTPGATSYIVERSPNGSSGWTSVGNPTNNSYIDSGLNETTTYYYRITAVNPSGHSVVSTMVDV